MNSRAADCSPPSTAGLASLAGCQQLATDVTLGTFTAHPEWRAFNGPLSETAKVDLVEFEVVERSYPALGERYLLQPADTDLTADIGLWAYAIKKELDMSSLLKNGRVHDQH